MYTRPAFRPRCHVTIAELHGKLSPDADNMERLEDLLTSDAFGTIRYIADPALLLKVLRTAHGLDGQILDLPEVLRYRIHFWPRLSLPGETSVTEPDVVLELDHNDGRLSIVMVEAKLYSAKGRDKPVTVVVDDEEEDDEEEGDEEGDEESDLLSELQRPRLSKDQLVREYRILQSPALLHRLRRHESQIAQRYLVFWTAHYGLPRRDLRESVEALQSEPGGAAASETLMWSSWRSIWRVLREYRHGEVTAHGQALAEDLVNLLDRKGLRCFEGFRKMVGETPLQGFYESSRRTRQLWEERWPASIDRGFWCGGGTRTKNVEREDDND